MSRALVFGDVDQAVIDRMADTMIAQAGFDSVCTEDDLLAAGFTRAQIARYGDAARALARDRRAAPAD